MPAVATRSRSVKLNRVGGRLVSAKSKTGNPACSEAMSAFVRSRHGGPAVGPAVFAMLGKCRSMARQNKKAEQLQAAGKLAEGRGTWQRSERAAQLLADRRARAAKPAPAADDFELGPIAADAPQAPRVSTPSAPVKARAQRGTPERQRRAAELRAANPARQQARHDAAEVGRAYQEVSGGKANVRVRLADIRDRLQHIPRERQDAALMHLATTKHRSAMLAAFDGQHGATARDRAAALKLPTGHTRDFIYLGGPSSGGRGGFPVAPKLAKSKPAAAVPAIVEPPRLSLRQQADATKRKNGPDWARAGMAYAKVQRAYKKASNNAKRAIKAGNVERATRYTDRAVQLSERMQRIAPRLPGASSRDIPINAQVLGVTTLPAKAPRARTDAKTLSKKARAAAR